MVCNIAGDADSKAMQGIANDDPEVAQRVFKNREKSIGAKGKDSKKKLEFDLFSLK